MSPMSSLLGYKHLRSWLPLPFAFAGNSNRPSSIETKSEASSAMETSLDIPISSAPTSPDRHAPTPRPPPRQSSVLTSHQPRTPMAQDPTISTTLKENTLPPSVSRPSNPTNTTSPRPPSSAPILTSTPPASPLTNPTPHPQRPPPTPLPPSPHQPRGRTLTRSTSARRTLFPSRSSISLRHRPPLHPNSNAPTLGHPTSPSQPPIPSPRFPRYLGRHPSIDRLQLRSPRLPPLQEQISLHHHQPHTTPPLLSRPSAERQRSGGSMCYRSPSRSSSYRVVEDGRTMLYCGGGEKAGFVKVRSERQLVLRQGGGVDGGVLRASDDSGRTTRGGSEVPEREGGFGGDGSCDGEGVGLLGGKKREKGFRGRVGRLGRRLSVGDRRRRKREMEGEGEWDGEERGKEEACE